MKRMSKIGILREALRRIANGEDGLGLPPIRSGAADYEWAQRERDRRQAYERLATDALDEIEAEIARLTAKDLAA